MVAYFSVFNNLKILSIFLLVIVIYPHFTAGIWRQLTGSKARAAGVLMKTATDVVRDTYRRIDTLEYIKQDNVRTVPYEVGYMVFNINEKYRKMVDKYNTSMFMDKNLYQMELIMYLEEIELHYWDIDHMCSMLHEVERKYKVTSSLYSTFHELTSKERIEQAKSDTIPAPNIPAPQRQKQRKPIKLTKYIEERLDRSTSKRRESNWPIYYGWEISPVAQCDFASLFNASIFSELSWSVKLILLKDLLNSDDYQGAPTVPSPTVIVEPEDPKAERRVPGIESLVARRQEEETVQRNPSEDDNNMRLKLFRLMYETVRDSDLKCKRAELIRTHYSNSSVFEIGYLMGDVMDKFNIMSDISMTLKRLFHEWKPIEHINAYEQISNQAIEINHLIDIMKGISKQAGDSDS